MTKIGAIFRSQGVHGRTLACHARRGGSLPPETAKLYPGSLMVRTLAFQVGNTGSIPVQDARPNGREIYPMFVSFDGYVYKLTLILFREIQAWCKDLTVNQ